VTVHVVLPGDIDDPATPSGGNRYDRRVIDALTAAGRPVRELPIGGAWPRPGAGALAALGAALDGVPDDGVVLVDGLVGCAAPGVLAAAAARLRLVVLVHLPLADETGLSPQVASELNAGERAALHAARAVVATSRWAAHRLITRHGLPADRVHVAAPGVTAAPLATGAGGVPQLTCVAAVTPRKAHDVLIEALAAVADRPWTCVCVGAIDRDTGHVDGLRRALERHGLTGRVAFTGTRTGAALDAVWASTDLSVLASRAETYGMVVTEALARGIPVLATAVGGVPEALGRSAPEALGRSAPEALGGSADCVVPGLLVPPDDPVALAAALRGWLDGPELRERLAGAARARRAVLPGWDTTTRLLAEVLEGELAR
jgi:glycosyltransferase involved in cell wall biosynthesis